MTHRQPTLDDHRETPPQGPGDGQASGDSTRSDDAKGSSGQGRNISARPGRYGTTRRSRRPFLIGLVAAIAVVGLGWLIWAAAVHANPAVSGAIHVWNVASDSKATFTLTVERPDPSVAATCRVVAQANNFETVGEKTVTVPGGSDKLVDVRDSLRTIRRATSVSLDSCTKAG